MRRCEAGFTLIEVIVVTAIVALTAAALGTFFLGGASPAVASADRDIVAALDEARRTAAAFDAATLVFAPARAGSGYSARVYARMPGDPGFVPRNGPAYESTVTIGETAQPLGAPGFALGIDAHGTVTGYANFSADATSFTIRACPSSGAFTLRLAYEREVRTVNVPCAIAATSGAPPTIETPPAGYSPTPFPVQTCPANVACVLGVPLPGATPSAAPTSIAPVSPPPLPTPPAAPLPTPCPAGFSGSAPACVAELVEQYSAAADGAGAHTSTLFSDGSICDDDGCSPNSPTVWAWACPFGARPGSTGDRAVPTRRIKPTLRSTARCRR